MLALELAALLYAFFGYGVLLFMGVRTFIHLCVRWGLEWQEPLTPYAVRAGALATVPLVGVSLMIVLRFLDPGGNVAQVGLVLGLLAFIALLVYQAWVFAHAVPEEDDRGDLH